MSDLRTAAQQALEALEDMLGWQSLAPQTIQESAKGRAAALRAALAEPVQEQDIEDAIEAAYWQFDCRRSGLNEWASAPQSERDAFKAEARKLVKGYFPTRQAQDTKREMLAVADAFIRGKRAALAEPVPLEDVVTHGSAWSKDGKRIDPMSVYAEPVEPVAWIDDSGHPKHLSHLQSATERRLYGPLRPLYAAPPHRKPLTDEEIDNIWDSEKAFADIYAIARAIERAHGIV